MQKILTGMTILIVGLLSTGHATADWQQDILACYELQNNSDRLACYDSVTKDYKLKPAQTASTVPALTSPFSTNEAKIRISPPAQTDKLANSMPKADSQAKLAPLTDSFGQTKNKHEVQSVQSRLIGTFTEWKKGMKITLENGQVWKVTSNASGYRKMTNPKVTISRGIFSSFNAKVEGLNAKVKVKRIK